MERFHSLRPSGEGTYGTVVVCRERACNNRFCALKRFKEHKKNEIGVSWDVIREMAAYKLVGSHSSILSLFDILHIGSGEFVAVLEGMQRTLKQHYKIQEVSHAQTCGYIAQLEVALAHLHMHAFIHRDLKPDNIMIHDGEVVKIGDLGHGCFFRPGFCPTSDLGTLWYRAPEVASGRPYAFSSDWWSLGCIAVELLCKQPLYPCGDVFALRTMHLRPPAHIASLIDAASVAYPPVRMFLSSAPADRHGPRILPTPSRPSARVRRLLVPTEVNPRMRAILIAWLIEVVDQFRLTDPVLERTVELLDEVLDRESTKRSMLQMLGCACLVIAGKVESGRCVIMEDMAYISADAFSEEALRAEERRVLLLLQFDVAWPLTHGSATIGERRLKFDLWLFSTQRGASAPCASSLLDRALFVDVLDPADRATFDAVMPTLLPVLRRRHGATLVAQCQRK
jgi:serine/threonine protein kinase